MKINKEGRITIPMEIRKKHRITADTELEMLSKEGEGILIRPIPHSCVICQSTENLHTIENELICEECITNIKYL